MNANLRNVTRAAERVALALTVDHDTRDLYGITEYVMDETATLRRVSLFYRGSGRYTLTADEREAALAVLRERDDHRQANKGIRGFSPAV